MKYVRIDRNREHCGGVLEGETGSVPFPACLPSSACETGDVVEIKS